MDAMPCSRGTDSSLCTPIKRSKREWSRGQAFFIAEAGSGLEEICIDGTAAGRYYFVYVGEQWEDHRVNWDWFLVSENMDEVLWYDIREEKYLTLDEWRASDSYRDWL